MNQNMSPDTELDYESFSQLLEELYAQIEEIEERLRQLGKGVVA